MDQLLPYKALATRLSGLRTPPLVSHFFMGVIDLALYLFCESRRTRSGKVFSPFSREAAVRPEDGFDLKGVLEGCDGRAYDRDAEEAVGELDEDECELVPEPYWPDYSPPLHSLSPTSLPSKSAVISPSTPQATVNLSVLTSAQKAALHKAKSKKRNRQKHYEGEQALLDAQGLHARKQKTVAFKRARTAASIAVSNDLANFHRGKSGYQGTLQKVGVDEKREYTLDDPEIKTMTYVAWDGVNPKIVGDPDKDGRVLAVLAGSPRSDWEEVHRGAFHAMDAVHGEYHCSDKKRTHRRGEFPVATTGISYGGGRKVPGNVSINSMINQLLIRSLLDNPWVQRLVGFTNQAFDLYAPGLYAYYKCMIDRLCEANPKLERHFPNSVFACYAWNLGPSVRSYIHVDHFNLAFGWCAITALGDFDPKMGGHLILWDLKLVIEFPAGATIFIPSAILRHSNIGVRPGEKRLSFVQWTAGGLFRWVEFGFKSAQAFQQDVGKKGADEVNAARWKEGLDLLPRMSDFLE